jgi:tRNA(fMet)-specific endonuclease VapC
MNPLLLDTNVVSILFNRNHRARDSCVRAVAGHELAISFMSRAELLLWPVVNQWGDPRRTTLQRHLGLYATLYPDERTCEIWADIVAECRHAGRPVQTADAWIAASARQWGLPLVTADIADFEVILDLDLVPIVMSDAD